MTGLAAEGDRLRVLVGAIAAEDRHKDEDEGEAVEDEKLAAAARIVQIQLRISRYLCR